MRRELYPTRGGWFVPYVQVDFPRHWIYMLGAMSQLIPPPRTAYCGATMTTDSRKGIAQEAKDRLGGFAVQSIYLYGMMAAVRALIATHPDPDALRSSYDRFVGQMMAQPGFLVDRDRGIVLR